MTGIEVDKRRDLFPSAVIVDSISIVSGIQKEFLNPEFHKISFHRKKGMWKRKYVVSGGLFQRREYREIAAGIGSHIHVEVVAKEIAFPVRVPSPVAVRLRIAAFAVTGETAFFPAVAEPFLSLLRGSPDRVPSPARARCSGLISPMYKERSRNCCL